MIAYLLDELLGGDIQARASVVIEYGEEVRNIEQRMAYNLLTDRTDVVKPIGYDRSPSTSMTDTDMKYIRLYLEENYDLTSEKKIIDAADLAAHQNSYHPVRDYLNSLTWDGTERIRYCLHYFLGA